MSKITNVSDAWSLMRELASKVGAQSEISNADVEKLLKTADKDKNGVITEKEFVDAFQNSKDFKEFEEQYIKAFKLIAGLDGEGGSISLSDISETIKAYDKIFNPPSNNGSDDPSDDPTPPNNDPPKNDSGVKPVGDLSSKELSVLQSERSAVMSQLDSMRNEKATATAQAKQNEETTQAAFNKATDTFLELRQEKLEQEAETNEQAKQVLLLQDTQKALNAEITTQKSAVDTATKAVSTIRTSLTSLVAPPETISYTDEETGETVTETNPEYTAYLEEKAALEDELAAAEINLADQETALEELETDLTKVEDDLVAAIKAYTESEEVKNTLTEDEKTALAEIDTTKKAYDEAKVENDEISSQFDEEIDTLQANLKAYNDEIAAKKFDLPEDYTVKDGVITNGTDNLKPLENLPDNAEAKDDGTIVDKTTGKVIGYVTGSDDKKQIFLKVEREPESEMTFSERYIAARTLFDSNEGWSTTDFSQYNSTDLKGIRELYDDMVEKHNESIEAEEEKIANFDAAAETNLKDNPEVYTAVTSLISKNYENVSISPKTFVDELEDKDIDVSKLTPEELSSKLEEFVIDKYGLQYIEQYYPSFTNDDLKNYVGEGGVDGLKTADEATVKATIDKIMGDKNLTPYEKIQLLEMVKASSEGTSSHVDKILGADDTFFYTTLEEMTNAKNENNENLYTPADIIEFIRQYKVVDNKSTVLDKEKLDDKFIAEMVSLYEQTTDPYEKLQLERLIGSDALIELLPETGYEEQKASLEKNGFRIEENAQVLLQSLGVNQEVDTKLDENGNIVVTSKEEGVSAIYTFDARGNLLSYESPLGKFMEKDGKIVLEHVNKKGEKVTSDFPATDIEAIVSSIQSSGAEKLLNTAMTYFAEHPELHRRNYCVIYTQAVLKEFGIDIAGNSYNVYKKEEKIEASQLKPGDLYLSTNYPGSMTDSNEPRHVGIVASVTPNDDGTYTYVTIDFAASGVTVNVHNTGNKKEDWYQFRRPIN